MSGQLQRPFLNQYRIRCSVNSVTDLLQKIHGEGVDLRKQSEAKDDWEKQQQIG